MRAVDGCSGASVRGSGHTGGMTASAPTIDDIFDSYLRAERDGASGINQLRIVLVESLLRECLENDGEKILTASDRILLEAERNFAAEGAFARTMHAEDLLFVLPLFLTSPWLLQKPLEQRVQLDLVEKLTAFLLRSGLVPREGRECILIDIGSAIDRARWELNRPQRERQRMRRAAQKADTAERRAGYMESLRSRRE